jgi:hypothetical protein
VSAHRAKQAGLPVVAALAAVLGPIVLACSPATIAPPTADAGRDGQTVTPDSGTDGGSSYATACKDYAYARCTAIETCSSTSILFQFGTVQVCEQFYEQSCDLKFGLPSAGGTVAHVQACTMAISSWKCSDLIYAENVPPDCQIVPGGLANGATCAVSDQCQSAWCQHPYGSACGTCTAPPTAGQPCTVSSQCGMNLVCVGSTGTCATRSALGAACSAAQPCDDSLACVGGICTAEASPAGATCNPDGAGCNVYAGLTCDAATNTCQTLQLVNGGEACGQVGTKTVLCITGQCERGTCVQGAPLGAPCDLTSAAPCLGYAQCNVTSDGGTMGTCMLPGAGCQ